MRLWNLLTTKSSCFTKCFFPFHFSKFPFVEVLREGDSKDTGDAAEPCHPGGFYAWIAEYVLTEIFTPWKTNMDPENWWFGRGISFQLCGCLVSMLVFRGVSEKCYSPCLCHMVFLCLTTLASAKASLAWSILAIHMTSGRHAERKRHLESGCSKWLVAWAPRYFFVGYLGFLLSVRDPENAWQWEMMRSTLTALMKPSHETGFPVDGKDPCLDLYSTCSFPRFKEDQTTIQPVPLISSRYEQRYKPTHKHFTCPRFKMHQVFKSFNFLSYR